MVIILLLYIYLDVDTKKIILNYHQSTNMKDNLKKNSVVAISCVTFITSLGLLLAYLTAGVKGTIKPSMFFSLFGLFLLVIKLIENITKKINLKMIKIR